MRQSTVVSQESRQRLTEAASLLAKGELRQASLRGWQAAAGMMAAVAERRGWPAAEISQLYDAAARLSQESAGQRIGILFGVAGSLYSDYFEGWLPAELVQSGLNDVSELIDTLERMIS